LLHRSGWRVNTARKMPVMSRRGPPGIREIASGPGACGDPPVILWAHTIQIGKCSIGGSFVEVRQ
jgi:hypothetical protein